MTRYTSLYVNDQACDFRMTPWVVLLGDRGTDDDSHPCKGKFTMYFEFKLLGPQHVKGVRDPVEIREVVGAGRLHSRFEVSEDRGLVPLVGRDEELSILLDARDKVLRGQGQIVAVVGEPGVGKSRLFHEFKSNLKTGWRIVESSAASHAKQFPYVPLRALLTNYFDLAPGDLDDVRSQKVLDKCRSLDSNWSMPHRTFARCSGSWDRKMRVSAKLPRKYGSVSCTKRLSDCSMWRGRNRRWPSSSKTFIGSMNPLRSSRQA